MRMNSNRYAFSKNSAPSKGKKILSASLKLKRKHCILYLAMNFCEIEFERFIHTASLTCAMPDIQLKVIGLSMPNPIIKEGHHPTDSICSKQIFRRSHSTNETKLGVWTLSYTSIS